MDGELGNALSVVPHEGTWIEITGVVGGDVTAVSFPTRERGLKSLIIICNQFLAMSFPTRDRGLKFKISPNIKPHKLVVPHEGTWIEIPSSGKGWGYRVSFPTRERGLK